MWFRLIKFAFGNSGIGTIIVSIVSVVFVLVAWLLELDLSAIGESLSGFFGMIGERFLSICDTIGEFFGPYLQRHCPLFTETSP